MAKRESTHMSVDKRMFKHTVVRTKVANMPHNIPRGGIRL